MGTSLSAQGDKEKELGDPADRFNRLPLGAKRVDLDRDSWFCACFRRLAHSKPPAAPVHFCVLASSPIFRHQWTKLLFRSPVGPGMRDAPALLQLSATDQERFGQVR